MPVNLELKAKIVSPASILHALRKIGRPSETLDQTDTYFSVKSGRLKLREFGSGDAELIFYNRNEKKGRRWSNYTVIRIADPKKTKRFLKDALGIRVVVKKRRKVYLHKGQARIHLDKVYGLGLFIEFEVHLRKDKKGAISLYHELVNVFSIEEEDVVRCSYSDLMLQKIEE